MENSFNVLLQEDFLDMLIDTQREVERLGLKYLSNLFILKSLIYAKESNIKDVLNYAGVSWKKIEISMKKQAEQYIRNEKNIEYASFEKENDDGEFGVYCDTKTMETLENAVNYLLDSNEVGEVEFILAMFDNYDIYVEGFFRGINIDTRLIEGYYRSLEATLRTSYVHYDDEEDYEDEGYDDEEDYEEDENYFEEFEDMDEEEYQAMIEKLEYDNEKVVYKNRKVKAMMICLLYEDEEQEEDEE